MAPGPDILKKKARKRKHKAAAGPLGAEQITPSAGVELQTATPAQGSRQAQQVARTAKPFDVAKQVAALQSVSLGRQARTCMRSP